MAAVTLSDIERMFEILDRLGVSREAVVIPLKPASPGSVRVLETGKNKGKLEIIVDADTPLERWLPDLEAAIRTILELPAAP